MLGAAEIRAGDADVVVAGGMESMNGGPYLLPGPASAIGWATGRSSTRPSIDGLWCAVEELPHGHARRADRHLRAQVSRQDQDEFALLSHQNAVAAIDAAASGGDRAGHRPRRQGPRDGRERRRGPASRHDDRSARPAQARLRAARQERIAATRPAAPSPPATRPASRTAAPRRSWPASGPSSATASSRWPGSSATPRRRSNRSGSSWRPVAGVRRLLDRIEMPIDAFDLIEINEAFAAQALADGRELGFDWSTGQRQRRRDRPRSSHRRQRRPDRGHAPPRAAAPPGPLRPGDPVPWRRRLGGGPSRASKRSSRPQMAGAVGRATGSGRAVSLALTRVEAMTAPTTTTTPSHWARSSRSPRRMTLPATPNTGIR